MDPPLIVCTETAHKAVSTRIVSPTLITAVVGKEETEKEAASPSSIIESRDFSVEAVPMMTLNKTAEERFTDAQAEARLHGMNPSLKWTYCGDELTGATCGDAIFSREELLQLSTSSSCWAGR